MASTWPIKFVHLLVASLLLFGMGAARAEDSSNAPRVGVFYFPGWKDDALGLAYPKPWEKIKPFPERMPLLGWYDEGQPEVMATQLRWMREYGISYVVFDWYWSKDKPLLNHALEAYLRIPGPKPDFALMWANHDSGPRSKEEFASMMRYVSDHYLTSSDYLRVSGRPAFFIQLGSALERKARAIGSSTDELLSDAQSYVTRTGGESIFFIAGAGPGFADTVGRKLGYSAYFAYNYHSGPDGTVAGEKRHTHSYKELDSAYRQTWQWFIAHSDLPYIVPTTSGWDKRPWGGSRDPLHDNSIGTPEEFSTHLAAARRVLADNPRNTIDLILTCCWNEYGEGSIVEPTSGAEFSYLKAIQSTLGTNKNNTNK
ncbi:hypothetical protein LMG31506_02168 [Cupriavidus yeoncheonensis]|uniref:Glycosyltransferase WbsX n=1 Tax=Cupriavidus yeoncheonensis TaxID=1462994 RepID=A0A916ITA8_9BURK|nr:glycoside hydrolase family 99-like domain-containing protein [Cupriavidus yeoncheonensis]CAG2140124.1 hypothetical protein LMG31506_02168 [Cupriavidus yeoncheonensis]